jgi:hypothetical protein
LISHEEIPQHYQRHEQHDHDDQAAEEQTNNLAWSKTRHGIFLRANCGKTV